ncbi:hypothetical protein GQX74_001898 [Glossina fuscipes]|nr:hypothetical protein GQX74_001898 [Glossina fuscipes]
MSEKKERKQKEKKKGVGAANRPAMTSALSRCFSFPARGYDNRSCSHFRSCKICMILQSFYSEARTKYYPTTTHQRQTSYFWCFSCAGIFMDSVRCLGAVPYLRS